MSTSPTPTDHFVKVNGLNIHYLDWGGGSDHTLLLVHGQGAHAHQWDYIARKLHQQYRVIAIDQRGHGDSDHAGEGYAASAFASDLAVFAEALGIVPYDYCGSSLGGRNGIAYAGDYPDHLKHFVTIDYGPEMSASSARRQIGGMNRRPLGWRSIDDFVQFSSEQNPRASEEHHRTVAAHGLRLNYAGKYVPKADPEMFWINGSFGAKEVPYLWEQWAKIRCPILEIKGSESDFLSPDILSRMREPQPNMQLVEAPDAGHSITADNPEFIITELRRFLVD